MKGATKEERAIHGISPFGPFKAFLEHSLLVNLAAPDCLCMYTQASMRRYLATREAKESGGKGAVLTIELVKVLFHIPHMLFLKPTCI